MAQFLLPLLHRNVHRRLQLHKLLFDLTSSQMPKHTNVQRKDNHTCPESNARTQLINLYLFCDFSTKVLYLLRHYPYIGGPLANVVLCLFLISKRLYPDLEEPFLKPFLSIKNEILLFFFKFNLKITTISYSKKSFHIFLNKFCQKNSEMLNFNRSNSPLS